MCAQNKKTQLQNAGKIKKEIPAMCICQKAWSSPPPPSPERITEGSHSFPSFLYRDVGFCCCTLFNFFFVLVFCFFFVVLTTLAGFVFAFGFVFFSLIFQIGFTSFEKWLTFSPAKNDLESGAAAAAEGVPPGTVSSAESDFYAQAVRRLQKVYIVALNSISRETCVLHGLFAMPRYCRAPPSLWLYLGKGVHAHGENDPLTACQDRLLGGVKMAVVAVMVVVVNRLLFSSFFPVFVSSRLLLFCLVVAERRKEAIRQECWPLQRVSSSSTRWEWSKSVTLADPMHTPPG